MSPDSPVVDAYAHVGLPRFLSVEDYLAVMSRNDIGRAVLCSFDSSPDFGAIHGAISCWPERFRGLGVPLGNDRSEIEASAHIQLAAGFSGLRLSESDVTERRWLLDIVADHGGIAVVCGQASSPDCVGILLAYLERNPAAVVIGGHFAGVGDPALLAAGPAAELFSHPRFHVVFSRHGGYSASSVMAWGEAVVARTGWKRILWGSETPVLFWRNETIADALVWADRLLPTADERAGFLGGNAARLYFAGPARVASLSLPFHPRDRARSFPATVFANGLPIEQSVAGRLVQAWLAGGGQGSLGAYLETLLDGALPPLAGKSGDN